MKKDKSVIAVVGGKGVNITGRIDSSVSMAIEAFLKGDVVSHADVEVRQYASIEGNVAAKDVTVCEGGTVTGNITASGRVIICKGGMVNGDILCSTLTIDEGGFLRGRCSMVTDDSESGTENTNNQKDGE